MTLLLIFIQSRNDDIKNDKTLLETGYYIKLAIFYVPPNIKQEISES